MGQVVSDPVITTISNPPPPPPPDVPPSSEDIHLSGGALAGMIIGVFIGGGIIGALGFSTLGVRRNVEVEKPKPVTFSLSNTYDGTGNIASTPSPAVATQAEVSASGRESGLHVDNHARC